MAVWDKKILWAVMLVLTGALGQRVNYPDPVVNYPNPVCGVKGSTVLLPCSFTPLKSVMDDNGREVLIEIIRVVWCQNHEICQRETPSVYDSESNNNNSRYRYLGDKKRNCTLQISDLQKEDDATLRFRMEANDGRGHFTERSGVRVRVEDGHQMKIRSSRDDGEFKRGEAVTLSCFAAICTIHQLEVTWFRDGHALSETGPALHLSYLTAEDSGNYTCGLKKNIRTLSVPYSLHVEADEEGGGLALIVGLVVGVLLVLFAIILVFCIMKRKRAAGLDQTAVGRDGEQEHSENIYSNDFLQLAEQQGPSSAVEEVSYASVQFTHKKQARPVEEVEDSIIYSSVARTG